MTSLAPKRSATAEPKTAPITAPMLSMTRNASDDVSGYPAFCMILGSQVLSP